MNSLKRFSPIEEYPKIHPKYEFHDFSRDCQLRARLKYHKNHKVGCVFPMVVVAKLPHPEFGRNDHWKDAPHII